MAKNVGDKDRAFAESLCNLDIPDHIAFSPNGQKILYTTSLAWDHKKGEHNVSKIWLASSGKAGSSRQLTAGMFHDDHARWFPDGERIAFISDRAKAGGSSALWVMNLGVDGGGDPLSTTDTEKKQQISGFDISPDGKSIAFISADESKDDDDGEDSAKQPAVWGEKWEYGRLRVVDVESKKVTTVAGGERHIVDAKWSPDGKRIVFGSTQNTELAEGFYSGTTLWVVEADGSNERELYTVPNDCEELLWAPDGNLYFITGVPISKGSAGHAVYMLNPEISSAEPKIVASGIDDDAAHLKGCGREVLAGLGHRLDYWICPIGKAGDAGVLLKGDVDFEAWDVFFGGDKQLDEPVIAVAKSDINNPVEVYTTQGGKTVQLSNHGAAFKEQALGTFKILQSKSKDGEAELDGVFLTPSAYAGPDGSPTKPVPTFVMCHGGPLDRNCNCFDPCYLYWTPYILARGYAVLLPQYRGSIGRGEKFASYSLGGLGDYDYDDVISITNDAVSRGFADPDRLMVGGWSQGGYLTYLCSTRNGLHGHGWSFKAAVPGAGVSDIDTETITGTWGTTLDHELNGPGKLPWLMDASDTTNRKASALWEMAAAVRESKRSGKEVIPPLLILHGDEDEMVPIANAEGFRKGLRMHGLPFEYVRYPGEGHGFSEQRNWVDMLLRIGRWCDKYLGMEKVVEIRK